MDAVDLVVKAIGWTLIHSIWLGALAALAYAIPAARLRNQAPQSAYAWGLCCLLGLVLLLLAAFVHELERVRGGADQQAIAAAYAALPVPFETSTSVTPRAQEEISSAIEPLLPFLVLLWAAAVIVIGSGLLRSQLALRRLVAAGVVMPQLVDSVVDLARHFGVGRSITVVSSALARAPFVIGHFSPVIVLPLTVVTGMPWPQLRLILAHEIAHLRRADYLVNWLQIALEVLLFFHPAVRWMSEELRRLREACCDDMVVAFAGGRGDYTRALLSLEENRHDAPLLAPSAVAGGLLWRVQRIAGRAPNHRGAFQKLVLPALFLSLIATLVSGGLQIQPGFGPRDISLPQADLFGRTEIDRGTSALRYAWQAQLPPLGRAKLAPTTAPAPAPVSQALTPTPVVDALPLPLPIMTAPMELAPVAILPNESLPSGQLTTAAAGDEPAPIRFSAPLFPKGKRLPADSTLAVEVSYGVDANGRVIDIQTIEAPADAEAFVSATHRGLSTWRYPPTTSTTLADMRLRHRFIFRDDGISNADGDCTMVPGTRVCVVGAGPSRHADIRSSPRRCTSTTGSRLCRR